MRIRVTMGNGNLPVVGEEDEEGEDRQGERGKRT